MTLGEIKESFYAISGQVSDLTRKLALAGIAIIWIFKTTGTNNIPKDLYLPLFFFCIALLTDIMQYLYGTIVWGLIVNTCGKTKDDDKVDVFEWINVPTWVLFALKVVLFLIAYYFLLVFVVKKGVI